MIQNPLHPRAPACPSRAASGPGRSRATLLHREAPAATDPTKAVQQHPKGNDCWWRCKRTRDCGGYKCRAAEVAAEKTPKILNRTVANDGIFQMPPAN